MQITKTINGSSFPGFSRRGADYARTRDTWASWEHSHCLRRHQPRSLLEPHVAPTHTLLRRITYPRRCRAGERCPAWSGGARVRPSGRRSRSQIFRIVVKFRVVARTLKCFSITPFGSTNDRPRRRHRLVTNLPESPAIFTSRCHPVDNSVVLRVAPQPSLEHADEDGLAGTTLGKGELSASLSRSEP